MRIFPAALFAGAVLFFFVGCADDLPDLPSGEQQQLNRPATLGDSAPSSLGEAPSGHSLGQPNSPDSLGNPNSAPPTVPGER